MTDNTYDQFQNTNIREQNPNKLGEGRLIFMKTFMSLLIYNYDQRVYSVIGPIQNSNFHCVIVVTQILVS